MGKAQPRISFVVPVYNMERYVGACLESILTQEGDHNYRGDRD